ncbi:MAG: fructose 1,6-bisphosphatase [Micromonosporaceae bacterium]
MVALGFQIHHGELIGPRDLFADVPFARARAEANRTMDYLRRRGPFEPHRLSLDELEYTTMPELERRIADRWQPITAPEQPHPTPATIPAAGGVPAAARPARLAP